MTRTLDDYLNRNCFLNIREMIRQMLMHSLVFANLAKLEGVESPTPEELSNRIWFETLAPPDDGDTYQDIYGEEDAKIADMLPEPPDWLADKTPFVIVYGNLENTLDWQHIAAPQQYMAQTDMMLRIERRLPDNSDLKAVELEFEQHFFGLLDELVDLAERYGLMASSIRAVTPPFLTQIDRGKLKGERQTGMLGFTTGVAEE